MIVLQIITMGAIVATAAFFLIFCLAVEGGVRESRDLPQPRLDAAGRMLIGGVRTAHIVGYAALALLTVFEFVL